MKRVKGRMVVCSGGLPVYGAYVAALDHRIVVVFHELVGAVQIPFVVDSGTGCLMVHDELHALALGIVSQLGHIEVRVGGHEVEYEVLELAEPVFPALVPALYQDSLDVVGRCEIDVSLDVLGIGGMGAVGCGLCVVSNAELYVRLVGIAPSALSGSKHLPPYAYEFLRPYPVGVLNCARLVEVENHTAFQNGRCVVCDDDSPPRSALRGLDIAPVA